MNELFFESVDPRKLRRIGGLTILALVEAIVLTSFTVASMAMMPTLDDDSHSDVDIEPIGRIEGIATPALIAGLVSVLYYERKPSYSAFYVDGYGSVRAGKERRKIRHSLEDQTKGQFFFPLRDLNILLKCVDSYCRWRALGN